MPFNKKPHSSDEFDSQRVIDETAPFAVREAFRTLYTNVLYLPIDSKCKKIAITSAVPGEGKTYVSINLALTLSQNADNCRVLLIDMDMRKPRVARILSKYYNEKAEQGGLSEYLAGIAKEPNFVETDSANFSILFSGAEAINPTGLINSSRMEKLIEICKEKFDYVIIDTPPVNVVSDSLMLVKYVDGYILATRADYSKTPSVSEANNKISQIGGKVFGVVLSSYNPKLSKDRYGVYSSYSNYDKR